MTTRNCSDVLWSNLGEVRLKLHFAIFFTSNMAIFRDGGLLIIGAIATRVFNVAPVGSAINLVLSVQINFLLGALITYVF